MSEDTGPILPPDTARSLLTISDALHLAKDVGRLEGRADAIEADVLEVKADVHRIDAHLLLQDSGALANQLQLTGLLKELKHDQSESTRTLAMSIAALQRGADKDEPVMDWARQEMASFAQRVNAGRHARDVVTTTLAAMVVAALGVLLAKLLDLSLIVGASITGALLLATALMLYGALWKS